MNAPTNPVLHVPAHKQTNPAAKPGQIRNHYDEFEEIVVLQGRTVTRCSTGGMIMGGTVECCEYGGGECRAHLSFPCSNKVQEQAK